MSLRRSIVLALVCAAPACADPGPPEIGARTWVGEHLEVWTTAESTVCGGSFAFLDRHAGNLKTLSAELGVEARADRFRYYWVDLERWQDEDACDVDAAGCAFPGGDVYARDSLVSHELVHGVSTTYMQSVFEEGWATIFGDANGVEEDMVMAPTLDMYEEFNVVAGDSLAPDHYPSAAFFTRLLLDLYPEEAFAAIQRTSWKMDYDQVAERLDGEGIDLDHVVSIYESAEGCPFDGVRVALTECETPATPWVEPDRWAFHGALDCGNEQTYGPRRGAMWSLQTVDIPEAGFYRVSMTTERRRTWGRFMACDSPLCQGVADDSRLPSRLLVSGAPAFITLAAGRYWFRVERAMADGPDPSYMLEIARQ